MLSPRAMPASGLGTGVVKMQTAALIAALVKTYVLLLQLECINVLIFRFDTQSDACIE